MKRLQIFGATASPYTQKMLALMRYRRIPYDIHWGETKTRLDNLKIEAPKPVLLPVILFENQEKKTVATTDSTPMIRRLEEDYTERSVIPNDPALAFINYLLEDFGDEWITKYMFHYRWHFEKDADKAGTILPLIEFQNPLTEDQHEEIKNFIIERQTQRLWVVGSSNETADLIESSFNRFLIAFNKHLITSRFLLGDQPSSADFAFFGQISQIVNFDPTPREICHKLAPRVIAWVELMNDLSGLNSDENKWVELEQVPESIKSILSEFGKLYAPLLLENAKAVQNESLDWEVNVDGSIWKQKTFSYQAKCLKWIKEEFCALNENDRQRVKVFLSGTDCEQIL
tara:strand:+ start:1871 stop:2899 length:1029 start_codon:yes stop_codon:yes gene_type:complete